LKNIFDNLRELATLQYPRIIMSNIIPALKIQSDSCKEIREFLKNKLSGGEDGKVAFRRVSRVLAKDPVSIKKIISPNEKPESLRSLKGVSKAEMERHIQADYRSFFGFTYGRAIRDEPEEIVDKELFFHSENYSQVDATIDFTFGFSKDRRLCTPIAPVVGDLIFVFLSNKTLSSISDSDKKNTRVDAWFVVSDQFLRAWTAIMYDWHETFDRIIANDTPEEEKEFALREKLFSGNRLMTNAWLKHKLALGATGEVMSPEESASRYWHLRTEYASKRWVDCWAAMVLIGRYGELPCPVNVPNNRNEGPQRVSWDLPREFVSVLLTRGTVESSICESTTENYNLWSVYCRSRFFYSSNRGLKTRLGFLDEIANVRADRLEERKNVVEVQKPKAGKKYSSPLGPPVSKKDIPNISSGQEFPSLGNGSVPRKESFQTWATMVNAVKAAKAEESTSSTSSTKKVLIPKINSIKAVRTGSEKRLNADGTKSGTKKVSISFMVEIPDSTQCWADMTDDEDDEELVIDYQIEHEE